MSIALKARLLEQNDYLPSFGLLGSLSLPTGSGNLTSNRVGPSGGLLWNYNLEAGPGVFGTVLLSSVTGDDGRFFEAANAVGISVPVTDVVGSFIEYFGFYRNNDGGPAHNLNGGFTYLLTNNVQLDINGGVGLNGRADDWFTGAGFAFRF